MKKSTIWILGIVMGLSFLSLLYLQVSYIEEMVKMRREQFDESVRRSLDQACRNIELVETKKYLEDDVVATERAAPNYTGSRPPKEGKEENELVRTYTALCCIFGRVGRVFHFRTQDED